MMEYTADVIVGFPGETEEMFQNTYDSLEKIGFSHLHIFPYSDREGTSASRMDHKIESGVKRERVGILENLQKKIEEDRRKYYLGKRLEVDRKSTRLNSSHANISYAVFCLKKKKNK